MIDRGPGPSPEMKADAFTPFVSSKPDGFGFGLAICRTIARAHGGALAFDDRADRRRMHRADAPAP